VELERIYREHGPDLLRYLRNLVGDDDAAADAVQEAFCRLVERKPDLANVRAWLFRVATRLALESARTGSRRSRLLAAAPQGALVGDPPADPASAAASHDLEARVRCALQALSERDRTVLLMRSEGFSHRDIAAAVGITTGSVGTVAARALVKVAAELGLAKESVQ
jgi:RNA polymerase sigma factor (sigma-70 family)